MHLLAIRSYFNCDIHKYKWVKDINIMNKSIKLSEENIIRHFSVF